MKASIVRRVSAWATAGCRSSISKAATSRSPTKTGRIWIVFNGEIYNFEELNRRYLSSGHTFQDALRHRNHRPPV